MGKNNVVVNRWLSQKERFADLMNGYLFHGQQIVFPEQLEQIDRETDILIPGKNEAGKKRRSERGIQRYRDIAMRWRGEAELAVLALENQEMIHYAMPVRSMIYDGLSYAEQIEAAWKNKAKSGKTIRSEEFLSHFQKTDRLCPVITLVFYYGTVPWDGNRDLHGMIFGNTRGSESNRLQKYVPNYSINLLDAERISNLDMFHTDLQYVLNMIKYRGKKEKLLDYVETNRSYFQSMNVDSYQALCVFLNSEKWLEGIERSETERGEMDMCKALEDIFEDGRMKGIEQGIEQGIIRGKTAGASDKLREQITKKLRKKKNLKTIAEELEESMETVCFLAQEIQKQHY